MNRRLNLYKDKLPKRKRRASDDDVYIKGMYNSFLDTTGYVVEEITTAEKGVSADFPVLENLGWMFDSEVKDYEALLKDRRNKMTQTFRYMLQQNSITSASEQSLPSNINEEVHNKQVSSSSGGTIDKMDDVRYTTKISSPLEDLATVARVGGKIIYYTGKGIGQGIGMAVDGYNWLNNDDEDEREPEPPINEEVYERTRRLNRRGASRSRSNTPEEQPSGSNQAMRLIRRGASKSRSLTPPKKNISNINEERSYY